MKKKFVLLLFLTLSVFALVSCVKDAVTYCPFCGKSDIKEISKYEPGTGTTSVTYECQNSNCGKKFGAGLVD